MQRPALMPLASAAGLIAANAANAALINETFSDAGDFTTSIAQFVQGTDYFFNTGSTLDFPPGSPVQFTNPDGGFFAAQDLDGPPPLTSTRQTLTFGPVEITGIQSLDFAVDLAEDDDFDREDWDIEDFVRFELIFDDNPPLEILLVASTEESRGGDDFNGYPLVAGIEVTDTFQTFTVADIPTGGAASVELVVTIDLGSADEDIALDNVLLIPAPSSGAVAMIAAAALFVRCRPRRAR